MVGLAPIEIRQLMADIHEGFKKLKAGELGKLFLQMGSYKKVMN